MDVSKAMSLTELNDLFWQHKDALGHEEQRLFQGILLELAKGEGMEPAVIEKLILDLGQRTGLQSG